MLILKELKIFVVKHLFKMDTFNSALNITTKFILWHHLILLINTIVSQFNDPFKFSFAFQFKGINVNMCAYLVVSHLFLEFLQKSCCHLFMNWNSFIYEFIYVIINTVSGQSPSRKNVPQLVLELGLGLELEFGLGGNFLRGQVYYNQLTHSFT